MSFAPPSIVMKMEEKISRMKSTLGSCSIALKAKLEGLHTQKS